MFDKERASIAMGRHSNSAHASDRKPTNLVGNERRAGCKRAKRDIARPPSEPDCNAELDDDTIDLIYQEKQICGILSRPEYVDSDDGSGALMTKSALSYVAQGKSFVDEAYDARNFRISKIRARCARRNRDDRL